MKIVIASDSFKGSLDAVEIADIAENISKKVFPDCQVVKMPMADGGEGTTKCLMSALGADEVSCQVQNPLGELITAKYAVFDDTAIMEMAAASGLTLIEESKRDIMKHSTFGTGQMLIDALEKGYKNIYLGIGGSGTNDGGIGFANAIGVKFLDCDSNEIVAIAENFLQIHSIDLSNINPLIKEANIKVMSDVSNPLLGELGATNVFGKQKGADEVSLKKLENGLTHYAKIAEKTVNKQICNKVGAGAAGGLGAALMLFTNAVICSGVGTILEILNFEDVIADADLIITGEGMMDYQSAYGKATSGVALACKKLDKPCIAVVGSMGHNAESMYCFGITSIFPIINSIMSLDFAIKNAQELYESALERALKTVKIGLNLNL